MLPLSQLLTPSTREEILQELLDIATSLGLSTTSWQAGQPLRTLLTTVAQKMADQTITIVEIVKGGFGDLASEDWAPLWAKSIYDVDEIPAEAATGVVTATNSRASVYTEAIGEFIVAHATTGKLYRNTAAIVIPALGSLANIAIASDELGTANNAAPGAITRVVTSLVGVTVTNPAAVLGADAEKVAALVSRSRSKLGALSPDGPKDAYNFVAKTPLYSPTSTPITRSTTTADPDTGEVTVCIATAAGAPTAPDVAIVQAGEDEWAEPWCVTSTAVAASNNVIDFAYQVWVRGTVLTAAQIETAIATALADYFSTIDIGGVIIDPDPGYVFLDEIIRVIGAATPGIIKVTLSLSTDVPIGPTEVPVLGTLTPTITMVL